MAITHNLPAEHTPPIGRERETAAVRAFLLDPTTPLVTLVGPGGMGKTTLALHLAYDILGDFPDGVHFIDLTPLAQADLIPGQIARTVGVEESPGRTAEDALIDHYHDRRALLLLDNFEHLLGGATAIGGLIRACPGVHVLATSREALRLREEQVYPLLPLALPDPKAHARSRRNWPKTRPSTCSCAGRRRYDPALSCRPTTPRPWPPSSPGSTACRWRLNWPRRGCGCFPPAVLLARLEASPLGTLVGGARDAPERQQTVRATIAWSYDLLEPAEQRLFRRLGVFADGFTLEAAEAVVAGWRSERLGDWEIDVLEGLESLLDKSLITRLPVEDELRFGLLETLRAFALEQLDGGGRGAERPSRPFRPLPGAGRTGRARTARAGAGRLAGTDWRPTRTTCARRWTGRWRIRSDGGIDGLRLAGALGDFWYFGNRAIEGRRWLDRALALSGAAPPTSQQAAVLARAYSVAGTMAWLQSDLTQAIAYHEQALAAYREIDDLFGIADSLSNLASQLYYLADYDKARSLSNESLATWRQIGNDVMLAQALNNRSLLESSSGDYQSAHTFIEQATEIALRSGDGFTTMISLNNLGQLDLHLGRLEQADELLHRAFDRTVQLNNNLGRVDVGLALGRLREAQSNPRDAWRLTSEALAAANELRFRVYVADGLEQAAFALNQLSEPARAARLLGAAAALRRRLGMADTRELTAYYDARLPVVREALGEDAFAAGWDAGGRLSRDEAVGLAMLEPTTGHGLQTTDGGLSVVRRPSSADPLAELTPREREVALMMARGMTNEEIGDELFITLKTVEKHAGNALGKLGLRSRVELAAWMAEWKRLGD